MQFGRRVKVPPSAKQPCTLPRHISRSRCRLSIGSRVTATDSNSVLLEDVGVSSQLKLADLIGCELLQGLFGSFCGVVKVAGRALQPFLPFPKQILSSFAFVLRLVCQFCSFRRDAWPKNSKRSLLEKKKEANFANFAYPISACDFLPCNWDLSCFNFDLPNTKKKNKSWGPRARLPVPSSLPFVVSHWKQAQ